MPKSNFVHLDDCEILSIRNKAIRVKRPDGTLLWLPRSVVDNDVSKLAEGDTATVTIQEWFAEKEGIEEDG